MGNGRGKVRRYISVSPPGYGCTASRQNQTYKQEVSQFLQLASSCHYQVTSYPWHLSSSGRRTSKGHDSGMEFGGRMKLLSVSFSLRRVPKCGGYKVNVTCVCQLS